MTDYGVQAILLVLSENSITYMYIETVSTGAVNFFLKILRNVMSVLIFIGKNHKILCAFDMT